MNRFKKSLLPCTPPGGSSYLVGCTKWARSDKSNIYEYAAPPPAPGGAIPASTPLCGSIKGVMLAGNTYALGCTINIPSGDTSSSSSPRATVYAQNNCRDRSAWQPDQPGYRRAPPNVFTVPGVAREQYPDYLPINLPGLRPCFGSLEEGASCATPPAPC